MKIVSDNFKFPNRVETETEPKEIDTPISETKYIETKANVQTSYLMFGWLGPRACELKATICLDLISIIFGDGSSSRLQQNLVEKLPEKIFNMIGSEHYQFKDGNNFFIQANFKPECKDRAIELVKQELANNTKYVVLEVNDLEADDLIALACFIPKRVRKKQGP